MFTIICLGRIDFLTAVLNGVAMLTSDTGPAGYGGMVALGLLIGVLLGLMRGIITQRLEIQWTLLGWILFEVLFVPKVTVNVEDIYTGAVVTVANVPLGPAAIGSITSTVGVTLADAFGTVFAYPSMTRAGYMDALEVINSMRDMDYGGANDGDATHQVAGIDLQQSLRAYMVDCVFYDMAMGLPTSLNWEKVREAPDILGAINVDSNTWFTTVFLVANQTGGQTQTCHDAYVSLSNFVHQTFFPQWNVYLSSLMQVPDATAKVQASLDALFNIGHDAQTYMLNALMKKELELAELGYQAQSNNSAGVVMRVQAMEQRRTQWAVEQSLWAEMARPIIAFIEGFFYAVSPFAAFMFVLGAPGIALFGRYVLLALWIQLWMPILAISNLYISIAASSALQHIGQGGADPLSIAGLDSVWTETASWLAIGGSMVAATPLLSLILLTGSYFALTSLTNRLGGSQHIDSKIVSPDIMHPAPFASVGASGAQLAGYSNDPTHGTAMTGIKDLVPRVNVSSDVRNSFQSAETALHSAAAERSEVFSSALDLTHQQGRDAFTRNMNTHGFGSVSTQTDSLVKRMASDVMKGSDVTHGLSEQENVALQAAIGVAMQASAGQQFSAPLAGGGGTDNSSGLASLRGSVNQSLQNIRSLSDAQREQIADKIVNMVSTDSGDMAQLAEKAQQDSVAGTNSRFFSAMQVTDGGKWAQAYRDSRSANHSFQDAAARSNNVALRSDLDLVAVGHLAASEGWTHELTEKVSSTGGAFNTSEIEDQAGFMSRVRKGMPLDAAIGLYAAASLGGGSSDSRLALADVLSRHHFGTPPVTLADPQRDQPLVHEAPKPGAINPAVDSHVTPVDPRHLRELRDAVPELTHIDPSSGSPQRLEVQQQVGSPEDFERRGTAAVNALFEAKRSGNHEKVAKELQEIEGIIVQQKAHHYENTFQESRGFLKAVQDFDITGQPGNYSIHLSGLSGAARAYSHTFAAVFAATGDLKNAAGAGLAAAYHGYATGFTEAVAAQHKHAYEEAKEAGLPPVAAQFYADQNTMLQAPPTVSLPRWLGTDAAYEKEKLEVKALFGDKGEMGLTAIDRAATAERVAKSDNLARAVSMYQSFHPKAAPTPPPPPHSPPPQESPP